MKIKGSKVLVTGGAGFIGSHIVESLAREGAEVTVYDNLSFGTMANLDSVKGHVKTIDGDILDMELLKKSMKGHDIVSHQAAQLEIFLSIDNPARDLEINTVGTLNVLMAAREKGIKKVINASSACIYGQTETSATEDTIPVPNWAYGVSKLAAERYGTIYSRYNGLPVTSLRYGITYGEREWYRRVLTIFIKQAVLNKPLVVFGDGTQVRDFIYVKDAVKLHNLCIENNRSDGESYNAGTGIATRIVDLAHLTADMTHKVLGHKPDIVFEDVKEGSNSKIIPLKRRNPAELKMMLLNPKKAQDDLGWRPETALTEGLKNEILWARENIARWEKIAYTG